MMCERDRTCSDGFAECGREAVGAVGHCNGFGWVTMGGKPYRKKNGAANLAASTTKQVHERCLGTGMVACGCTDHGLIPGALEPAAGVSLATDTILALVRGDLFDVVDLDVDETAEAAGLHVVEAA